MNAPITEDQELVYRIDESDRLCEVNPEWTQFALANGGAAVMPERILGRLLWDFIEDIHTCELYRQLVRRARLGNTARFDYRCDAPEWRRRFRMTIRAAAGGSVEFVSRLRWEERRSHVDMLDANMPRSECWVRVCSWCQNLALPDGNWVPVEEAVERLGLLAEEALPKLTHGICPPCHSGMMTQIESAACPPCSGGSAQPPGDGVPSADP